MAVVLLTELHRLGLISLEGVIANLAPATKRARFGRGALDILGYGEVPIAVGSRGSERTHKVHDREFKGSSFLVPQSASFPTGEELLLETFKRAADNGWKVTLVLLSSLMDISNFIIQNPDVVKNTIEKVVVQGGMYLDSGALRADSRATNNSLAFDHALYFIKYVQDNRIPTTVYTDKAAIDTTIPLEFFGLLQATGHALGSHLRKTQIAQNVKAYEDLINNLSPDWPFVSQYSFLETNSTWFSDGHSRDPQIEPYPSPQRLVPFLVAVDVHDALAALGSVGQDVLGDLKVLKQVPNSIYHVIGGDYSHNFIKDSGVFGDRMADTIKALVRGSLLASRQRLT
jgi:hypothetical protein